MRWAAVPLSRGIGRPSAGTREVEEEFAGWEKRGGKAKGSECLRDLDERCEGGGRGLEVLEIAGGLLCGMEEPAGTGD